MSAVVDAIRTTPEPLRSERPARHLRTVERTRRRRPRVSYAIAAVAGALAIAAAQMGLSIAATESSYEVSRLTQQQRELTWQRQELDDRIAGLSSPQYLAANAASLGMVINQSPTYLRLSDGKILGSKKAATSTSSVNALGKGAVGNALVAETPLVTTPDRTMQRGAETAETDDASTLPPPITDGLPTPATR
ncbi:MAG: hypothetical protein QM602_02270 [Microbacterium sp.]